jgi:hypothetical protein
MVIETVGAVANDPARFLVPSRTHDPSHFAERGLKMWRRDTVQCAYHAGVRGARTFTCDASLYSSARRFLQPSERQKTPHDVTRR